ncbi:hypothetical protein [Methylobacter luteus]|uniref:hypothetical protein n=1 Tax=Methylobacter luteus TaxID=415 RepID=UPI00048A09C6|nr:hypothetical protein [Methylobacter luteus]
MNSPLRCAIIVGAAVFAVHLALALALFISIHVGGGAQAEFAWFWFMWLDYPISNFAWKFLATTPPVVALMDWGYTWGSGPNFRALFIHGLIGGAQWFLVGALVGSFFWPRTGYIATWRQREV